MASVPPRRWRWALAAGVALSCEAAPELGGDAEADRYITDRAWRRGVLERALWQPELPYSRGLLANYGLADSGWERLPERAAWGAPFRVEDADALARGEALDADDAEVPDDASGRDLGERVFSRLPMRADDWLDALAAQPALWPEVGLTADASGVVAGLVRFRATNGAVRVGVTCALCHSADGVSGRATRTLDLGLARAKLAVGGDAARDELSTWGPGRIDVTEGGVTNPTTVPDLFHLRDATYLNHSGVLAVEGLSTLAVRFETQFIQGDALRTRPPRALMWALATYVTSLDAPEPATPLPGPPPEFVARCSGCHDPDRAYGGDLVDAAALGGPQHVANDPERGTGLLKVPPLRGVAQNAPFMHDGRYATLAAVLEGGHPDGAPLPLAVRDVLIDFLGRLPP